MKSISGFFSLGVTVVSVKSKDEINAMTASWASPVSFSPPLITVNISPGRATHNMIAESGKFVLNLLAEDQMKLAEYLGSCSGRDTNKFEEGGIEYAVGGKTDAPLISGCVASLECELYDKIKAGDHTIFVGEVLSVVEGDSDKKPLLYHKSIFQRIGGGF